MKIKRLHEIEKYLVPDGTKVIYDGELGVVDGNDLETMDDEDEFEDINYYIIPSEHINDEAPSNHYMMLQREDFEIIDEEALLTRETIVMKALKVDEEDARKIVEHLIREGCEEWIDDYNENGKDEPLTDVHYEKSFDNMIDWQYEGSSPSEMLGNPAVIEEYPEMLQLKDKVIFWYSLV